MCKDTSHFLNNDDRVIILMSRYMFSAMTDPIKLSKMMLTIPVIYKKQDGHQNGRQAYRKCVKTPLTSLNNDRVTRTISTSINNLEKKINSQINLFFPNKPNPLFRIKKIWMLNILLISGLIRLRRDEKASWLFLKTIALFVECWDSVCSDFEPIYIGTGHTIFCCEKWPILDKMYPP